MATSPDGVLVYRSRYGTTLQYAERIKRELRIPLIDPERLDDRVLAARDLLVIGTPVFSGEMLIRDWLRQNELRLCSKRLFFFVVCSHFADVEKQRLMISDNIPRGLLAACEIFFVPGRVIIEDVPVDEVQEGMIFPLVESVRSYSGLVSS